MIYELLYYDGPASFTEDARRRNRMAKEQRVPLAPHLYWKVEQVIPREGETLLVLWSRPDPMPTR